MGEMKVAPIIGNSENLLIFMSIDGIMYARIGIMWYCALFSKAKMWREELKRR